jgi:hypothetical protein
MDRDALVVGINLYEFEQLSSLKAPAADAEEIAQLLTQTGSFRVRRLPEVKHQETNATRVGRKTRVTLTQLEEALVQLFKPAGNHIPETALFYFSGHGLRKDRGIQEGFLATSDVNPPQNNWGLRLKWLRELLQESPIRQQIVWLDCCYSGELLNFEENLAEADPGSLVAHDRCFIAASREYEVAYEETIGNHGVLTSALLQALNPAHRADGLITNFTVTEFVSQALRSTTQRPLFANFGNKIILTGRSSDEVAVTSATTLCPYRGLTYFDCNAEDAKFFYGRTALIDALLEKVRDSNFVAVLGASGSGKSSVVRAGLLYQLALGQRLSGSQQWLRFIVRPGERPLQNLAKAFLPAGLSDIVRADYFRKAQDLINTGAIGLTQLITTFETARVVLVIDQFEECFTLCRDDTERQQFFECLLGAVDRLDHKLCLVLTLRADFLGKCLQSAELAKQIEANLITVKPMNRQELVQAITEPAKQVGLEIEAELVTQMLLDVESSPGRLPLLQYTLTELWQRRVVNWLTLATYNALGGVRGTLQQRAEAVYADLPAEEQETARRIFLELTQLGEGTEDTRRQALKRDLITANQPEERVDRVIQRLSTERLIVTSELVERSANTEGRVQVIDVAHEALIRYWSRLRQWIEDNRIALKQKRTIEAAAEAWLEQGKPLELAYLLQGPKLSEAENFLQLHADSVALSKLSEEFVRVSQTERDRLWRRERNRKRWSVGTAIAVSTLLTVAALLFANQQQRAKADLEVALFSNNTAQALETLPRVLQQANDYRNEVDKLKQDNSNLEAAVNYYNQHKNDLDKAFAYYRNVLRVANRLHLQTGRDRVASKTIDETLKSAEENLSALLLKYRIPQLKQDLRQPKPNFGIFLSNAKKRTDFEDQYSKGALRTTYEILMRGSGAGADLNDDGLIRDQQEANQLPCATLKEIEQRWREATHQRCGWYGAKSVQADSDCIYLPSEFSTLTRSIFDFPTEYVVRRLNYCGINAHS